MDKFWGEKLVEGHFHPMKTLCLRRLETVKFCQGNVNVCGTSGFMPCFHFVKLAVVIVPERTHDTIPEQEIQAVVAFEELVMLVVVYGSIDPFTQPVCIEAFRIELPAAVTVNIVNDHEQEEEGQMKLVNGDGKQEDDNNTYFHEGFQRVKGIGSPGGGVNGFMVYQMENAEQCGMMHQAMGPVKISIMDEQHERECHPEIKNTMLMYIGIVSGIGPNGVVFDQQEWNKTE